MYNYTNEQPIKVAHFSLIKNKSYRHINCMSVGFCIFVPYSFKCIIMAEKVLVCHDTYTSSETTSDGKSWIDYWKEQKNQNPPSICPCCNKEAATENPFQTLKGHILLRLHVNIAMTLIKVQTQ